MTVITYLQNIAVFCIQVIPMVIFLFLPYQENDFRIRRKYLYSILGTAGSIAAAFFPFFSSGDLVDWYLDAALLLVLLVFYCLNRERFTKKSVTVFSSVFPLKAQNTLAMAYSAEKAILSGEEITETNPMFQDSITVLLLYLAAVFFIPLTGVFEKKILKEYLRMVTRRTMWLEIGILELFTVMNFMFAFFCVGMFAAMGFSVWCIIPVTLFLLLILALLYFVLFRTALFRAKEAEEQMHMALLRENTVSLQHEMEHSRDVYHDLRQLLRQLDAVSERDGFSGLKPYIEKIVSLTKHTDIFFCENKCLNALFQYYTGYAKEKHISMQISAVCGEISVDDTDLTLLISNALENALNAAVCFREQTGEVPEISAVVGIVKDTLAIQVINPCINVVYTADVTEQEQGTFLSANAYASMNEDGGRGLKRIQWIADKYHGRASFRFEKDKHLWTTRISLSVKKGKV